MRWISPCAAHSAPACCKSPAREPHAVHGPWRDRTLSDPEAELSALLGWWLPVGSLHAWLLGLTDPAYRASSENGADGTLAAFEQRAWRVVLPTYQLATLSGREPGVLVPRRIDLTHGELKLRLTIDDWRRSN